MIFNAFSIDEAISIAQKKYKCKKEDLKIHTITHPKTKFLGLIKHPGEYNIEYIKPQNQENSIQKSQDGYAEIISGKVIITDPSPLGNYTTITASDPNIDVYINNKKIVGTSIITERDLIELKPKIIKPYNKIEVNISSDKLEVILTITKQPGKKYYVKDVNKNNSIYITSSWREIPAPAVTLEQCIRELKKNNIKMKYINIQSIKDLLSSPEGGSCIAAKGIPSIDGIDSKVEYFFSNESYRNPDLYTDKKVDLLDHTIIPSTKIGQVLAVKTMPAIPGRDGETVIGEIIKSNPGKDIPLNSGKGTVSLDNNSKVVAAQSGRPMLKNSTINVIPLLCVNHDVDTYTGNIKFDGDIIIRGNIMDNIQVKAESNIIVYGNIYHAQVIAKGDITVYGSIISGKVKAGISVMSYTAIIIKLNDLKSLLENICVEIRAIKTNGNLKYQRMLKNILVKNKKAFNEIIGEIKKPLTIFSPDKINHVNKYLKSIQKSITQLDKQHIDSIDQIEEIGKIIDEHMTKINALYNMDANVLFNYAQNSFIQANGNITVYGEGSYQTNLIAKYKIIFEKESSFVKGGMVIAGDKIKIGIVGSIAGISTYCKIFNDGGKIEAAYCYDNTIININGETKIINSGSRLTLQ